MVSLQQFLWYCIISSFIISITREQSFTSSIKIKGDITDQNRSAITPISKAAIAKYVLSICKDNPYLTFPSKYFRM